MDSCLHANSAGYRMSYMRWPDGRSEDTDRGSAMIRLGDFLLPMSAHIRLKRSGSPYEEISNMSAMEQRPIWNPDTTRVFRQQQDKRHGGLSHITRISLEHGVYAGGNNTGTSVTHCFQPLTKELAW
jgi:hypothetical protein